MKVVRFALAVAGDTSAEMMLPWMTSRSLPADSRVWCQRPGRSAGAKTRTHVVNPASRMRAPQATATGIPAAQVQLLQQPEAPTVGFLAAAS